MITTDRAAKFAITLTGVNNTMLATVRAGQHAGRLNLPVAEVAGIIAREVARRGQIIPGNTGVYAELVSEQNGCVLSEMSSPASVEALKPGSDQHERVRFAMTTIPYGRIPSAIQSILKCGLAA